MDMKRTELEKVQDLVSDGVEFEQDISLKRDGVVFNGRYDCFDGETVYDFKTVKSLGYVKNHRPKDRYVTQLNIYMEALGVNQAQLVYIQKHDLEVYTQMVYRDESVVESAFEKAKEVKEKIEELDNPRSVIPYEECGCFNCRKEVLEE